MSDPQFLSRASVPVVRWTKPVLPVEAATWGATTAIDDNRIASPLAAGRAFEAAGRQATDGGAGLWEVGDRLEASKALRAPPFSGNGHLSTLDRGEELRWRDGFS